MIKANRTSDKSIRWIILAGELLALNAALLTMSFVYKSMGNITTPHYKRLMLLMTLVYILCDLQSRYHIHDRFVRGDQLLRSLLKSLTLFIVLSLMVMWVFRWPLMTWNFMLPFYGFIRVSSLSGTSTLPASSIRRWKQMPQLDTSLKVISLISHL